MCLVPFEEQRSDSGTQTHRGGDRVTAGAACEVLQLEGKEHGDWQPLDTGNSKKGFSSTGFRGSVALSTSQLRPSCLQNRET